ncbi:Serine/threonine-protein kinase PrkC [Microbulbifer aggregans]|uniref:Serine/threonine-protein kinase PrkC n=1 Tax=Microbulbifer aggregans TaxID=1769779 RepID=A0A1C9W3N4_9GAMM|nr:serine/threonine-protein kinase [Microbulbifer aggregans]AOS95759.1 Serine/threonine-protein kinase PrkC [Microbulbifer aggregans]
MEIAEPKQQQLGRYRIERTLGAGGMGVVYLAHDTKLHRPVAIKKLRDDATNATARARIQSEAQLLARLNHSNIVQLYDVLEERDGIALVMEYVEGTTLKQWMREASPTLRDKLSLLIQLCHGLTEAHSLGIIHRDLKPDNILIARGGADGFTAKITDFGIAKSLQADESITREDHVAGTVEVMSPEQLQGYPLCPRSDLFSLGTIAYELLCGSRPFDKDDKGENGPMALAQRVVHDPHTPPQQANPDLPEPFAALLDRLLAKNPEQRPETAEQVAEALGFLRTEGSNTITGDYSETVTRLLRKPPNKRKRLLATLAGVAALGSAGYWGWKEFTKLEPQYIAVLPVEIHGEVRGEENANALTATMVRQALMNATSQLKASALVSFTPKEGQDFDAQLQALRDKGVTDALFARLDCAQVRCEIELQRIGPVDSQIRQQASFAFLADKRQEAEYRVGNSAIALFPEDYAKSASEQVLMSQSDYNDYLDIVSRLDSKDVTDADLAILNRLRGTHPESRMVYHTLVNVSAILHVLTGDKLYLDSALSRLNEAKEFGVEGATIDELKLFLYSLGDYQEQFEALSSKLEASNYPIAELKNKRARYFYRNGKYEAGLQEAMEAAALNPSADNLYLIALNRIASGDYSAARSTLERLTETYPDHWSAYSARGVIELESGNLDEAEKAITAIPEELRGWRTRSNLGVVYFLQGEYEKARAEQERVLKDVPGNIATMEEVAASLLMLNEKEAATEIYGKILSLSDGQEDIESQRYRSLALATLGQISEAIAMINDLVKTAPEDTDIKYSAAQVFALAGEWRSANYYIEQLIDQGMSAAWFKLPALQQLCTQPQTSEKVAAAICN